MPDAKGTKEVAHEKHTKAPEGALVGATAGGAVGGTLGLLVASAPLRFRLGPFIAAGPIMAALAGSGVGGAVGTLTAELLAEDCRTGVAHCNPPPPPPRTVPACPRPGAPPDPGGPTCNPPHPGWIAAHVLKTEVQGDRVSAVVGRGSADAVTRGARCRVPAPHACAIVRVDKQTTLVTFDATTLDQVHALESVDLETNSTP